MTGRGEGPARSRGSATERTTGGVGERGSATVLVLGVIGVVLSLTVVLAALAWAANLRGAAQTAADLAALAGAQAMVDGQALAGGLALGGAATSSQGWGDPCALAAAVARANGAELTSCRPLPDAHLDVHVRKGRAEATARAGPVDS